MPAKNDHTETVENPPTEPAGVRTDLLENPDPEALARARGVTEAHVVSAGIEDPPRDSERAPASEEMGAFEDPPGEFEVLRQLGRP